MGRQIVLLDEHDAQAATGGVARDARSVDPAAHDQPVIRRQHVVRWR
jgi:hypothetical protein